MLWLRPLKSKKAIKIIDLLLKTATTHTYNLNLSVEKLFQFRRVVPHVKNLKSETKSESQFSLTFY